jgi:hypothetical protein
MLLYHIWYKSNTIADYAYYYYFLYINSLVSTMTSNLLLLPNYRYSSSMNKDFLFPPWGGWMGEKADDGLQ